VVHKLPADLRTALAANATALDAWNDITPLARNEFICWVDDAKQMTPRETPHSPHPGGTRGRPAAALLLAGVWPPANEPATSRRARKRHHASPAADRIALPQQARVAGSVRI
jgi:hypothetical protein